MINHRKDLAKQKRFNAAQFHYDNEPACKWNDRKNTDEERYKSQHYFANYTKGFLHNEWGEIADPADYEALLNAIQTQQHQDFEALKLGGNRKLVNPQAGFGFDMEGADAQAFEIPANPLFASNAAAAEMVELYWMAIARDIYLGDYSSDPQIAAASEELNKLEGYMRSVKASPDSIFRGFTSGDLVGPYISQFLLRDIPYGTLCISQKQKTATPQCNYMTTVEEWLCVQNGIDTSVAYLPCNPATAGSSHDSFSYIKNLRDLATYVHFDALYEAYLNACLILLGMNAPLSDSNINASGRKNPPTIQQLPASPSVPGR